MLVTDYLNCISRDCSGRCHLCRGGPGKQRLGRILILQQKPEFRCGSQSLAQTTDSLSVWRLSSSLSIISALSGNSRTSEISFQAFQIQSFQNYHRNNDWTTVGKLWINGKIQYGTKKTPYYHAHCIFRGTTVWHKKYFWWGGHNSDSQICPGIILRVL